jgi:lipopolysaccharide exporter
VPRVFRILNFRSELFSSTFTYGVSAIIKLGSSLVLTRILNPESYGIVAIMFSVAFILELVSDVGTVALVIRHERGGEARFIHTLWTVRLFRSIINCTALYVFAPIIASIYKMPVLTDTLRLFSFTFLLHGLESMSFVLAQRDQRSRITNYVDLATSAVMTIVVIGLATVLRNHYAFIYGILVQRLLTVIFSHFYYREIGVALAFDREAMADQFKFARVVLPSSFLTIALSQYDKVVLLKLFDLSLLGIYGIAGNIMGPIAGLSMRNARVVLYARCADYIRHNRATASERYYRENVRLMAVGTLLPAALGGLSQIIVSVLYDARYTAAGSMLTILAIGAVISSFQDPSENLLVAAGKTEVVLVSNIIRLITIIPISLLSYHFFGLYGFLWGTIASSLAVLAYLFREQRNAGMLNLRVESVRFFWAIGIFGICFLLSISLLHFIPPELLHIKLRRH